MAVKVIDRQNTLVIVQNNMFSPVYVGDFNIEMEENGDEQTITYDELNRLSTGKTRNMIRNGLLLIVGVISEEDYQVEDITDSIRFTKHQLKLAESINADDPVIETDEVYDFVINSSNEELIDFSHKFQIIAIEHATEAFRRGDIGESKMRELLKANNFADTEEFILDFIRD